MVKKIAFFTVLLLAAAVFAGHPAFSQITYYTVKGRVIDRATKAPLAGASVFAQNTTFGEATSADGSFSLKLPSGGIP